MIKRIAATIATALVIPALCWMGGFDFVRGVDLAAMGWGSLICAGLQWFAGWWD